MKYKRLSAEELQALESDFINFLASAQITAGDWEKMKKNELDKANELIEVFSDVVYDKVLQKISFLEFRDSKTLNVFHFTDDKVVLHGIRVKENSPLDLTAEGIMEQWSASSLNSVTLVSSEKPYVTDKQTEVFELLQSGCFITNDHLFKIIGELL